MKTRGFMLAAAMAAMMASANAQQTADDHLDSAHFQISCPAVRGKFDRALPPSQSIAFSDVAPTSPVYTALQAVGPYLGRQLLCFGCATWNEFYAESGNLEG